MKLTRTAPRAPVTIAFTRPVWREFRKAIAEAKGETFFFKGEEFLVTYARYLEQHIAAQFAAPREGEQWIG